jgi:hypothetical protein
VGLKPTLLKTGALSFKFVTDTTTAWLVLLAPSLATTLKL